MSIERRLEPISFRNTRGLLLKGVLHVPEHPNAEHWVILSHGMLSTKDSRKHTQLAEMLCEKGFHAFRFDYSGQGESEGNPEIITYSNGIDDLSCAMDLLKARGAKRFLLNGSSMGAGVSMLTAARRPEDVTGLSLLASVVRTNLIFEAMKPEDRKAWEANGIFDFEGRRVAFESVADAEKHDLPAALASLSAPVLFVHGKADELIPWKWVKAFSDGHSGRTEFILLDGADHRFSDENHRKDALNAVIAWIDGLNAGDEASTGKGSN